MEKIEKVELPTLILAGIVIFAFSLGVALGYMIIEGGADAVSHDVLDNVCKELYDDHYIYSESTGTATEFICTAQQIIGN